MTPLFDEEEILEFLGFLSARVDELHEVEVPRLFQAWEEFKELKGR